MHHLNCFIQQGHAVRIDVLNYLIIVKIYELI